MLAGMSSGCRDCRTCTMPAMPRWGLWWAMALLYFSTCGLAALVKKGMMRGCPRCGHLLGRHQRRADGGFVD